MKRRSQFRSFQSVYRYWTNNVTPSGRAVIICLALSSLGIGSLEVPYILLFSVLLTVVVAVALAGQWFRPRLTAVFRFPTRVMCGEEFDLVVVLTNGRLNPTFDVTVAFSEKSLGLKQIGPARSISYLERGKTVELTLRVKAIRRGRYVIPELRVASSFPFNLLRSFQFLSSSREILVVPSYSALEVNDLHELVAGVAGEIQDLSDGRENTGENQFDQHSPDALGEYCGNREYQPGLAVRRWDYSSWARLGSPVVREFHELRETKQKPRFLIVVDTFREVGGAHRDPDPVFEGTLSTAAALSDALIVVEENPVEVIVIGIELDEELGSGLLDQHHAILDQLAVAEPIAPQEMKRMVTKLEQWCDDSFAVRPFDGAFLVLPAAESPAAEVADLLTPYGCRAVPIVASPLTDEAASSGSRLSELSPSTKDAEAEI